MKKIINEEILRTQKLAGIISENQYNEAIEEGYSDGGEYNLSKPDNAEDMMRNVVGILAKYVGTHSTNNGAIANDNRVILYNMINSGDFAKHIQQMLPPSSMHYGSNGREYLSNNEEAMVEFLNSIGISTDNITFKPMQAEDDESKDALGHMFKGTTPDDIDF